MADIELVIKIDKRDYRAIKNKKVVGDLTIPYVFDAIRNGTPLPKGHGRLIDADALPLQYIDEANHGSNFIKIAPTVLEADKESE